MLQLVAALEVVGRGIVNAYVYLTVCASLESMLEAMYFANLIQRGSDEHTQDE